MASKKTPKVTMHPMGLYKQVQPNSRTEYAVVVAMEEAVNGDKWGTLHSQRHVPLRCKETDDAFQALEYVGSLSDVLSAVAAMDARLSAVEATLEKAKAAKAAKSPKASASRTKSKASTKE